MIAILAPSLCPDEYLKYFLSHKSKNVRRMTHCGFFSNIKIYIYYIIVKTAKPSQAAPIAEAGGCSGESEMSHSSGVRAPALTGFMISISHTEVYRA